MAVKKGQPSGLAYLLSLEQMPARPALRSPTSLVELEKWIERLEFYLRRMFGLFTADNISVTIIEAGAGIRFFDRLVSVTSAVNKTVPFLNEDCRGKMLHVWWPFSADTTSADPWFVWNHFEVYASVSNFNPGTDQQIALQTTSGSSFAEIIMDKDTGFLSLHVDATAATSFPDVFRIGMMISGVKTAPDITL